MAARTLPSTLTTVRTRQTQKRAADLALIVSVVDWAADHPATDAVTDHVTDQADLDDPDLFGPTAMAVAGPGAPQVEDFALYQLAATLGRTIESTSAWVGDILETRHRLPTLWARVAAGQVSPYRAFRIAAHTRSLNESGAAYVDRHPTPVAGTLSTAQLDRTVQHALVAFDPAEAERREAAAAERRHVHIDLGLVTDGTVDVHATLDAADALDLDAAVKTVARQLADLGSAESLDVRRSLALGQIARTQLALDLDTTSTTGSTGSTGMSGTGRGVTINVHLDPTTGAVDLDQPGLTATTWIGQLRRWCQTPGTNGTVRPVLDLNAELTTDSYTPTTPIRRHVETRDRHCVAPHCTRPARRCDLDHIIARSRGGATSTLNLAPLCRRHHRAKTHGGWRYAMTRPGTYTWTLPDGSRFTVDQDGTHPHPPKPD